MKVMVLTPYLPHRKVGHGGGTAVRDLVRGLAGVHQVLVVSLVRDHEQHLLDEVRELGAEVVGVSFPDKTTGGLARIPLLGARAVAALRSLVSGHPYYVEKYWSTKVARALWRAVESFAPEAIQVEYLQMGLYCRELKRRKGAACRLILNSHELGSVPRERHAALATNPFRRAWSRREAARWRRYQVAASGWADHTLCVTPEDHALFQAMGGVNLVTVPLGMDTAAIAPSWHPELPERYLFVGSFQHRPNRSAVEFILDRLWPSLRQTRPKAQLVLAGRGSQEFLSTRGDPTPAGVQALGFVEDLAPLFRASRLFIAPLTEGGGIKIKILEAMARGLPVVTSPVGAEGITSDPAILSIAPCDDSFAEAVLAAAADPEGSAARARAARRLIETRFSWQAIIARLTDLYHT